jgi:hypothetical protein
MRPAGWHAFAARVGLWIYLVGMGGPRKHGKQPEFMGANGGVATGGGISNRTASSLVVSNYQLIGNGVQGGTEGSNAEGGNALGDGLYAACATAVLQGVLLWDASLTASGSEHRNCPPVPPPP